MVGTLVEHGSGKGRQPLPSGKIAETCARQLSYDAETYKLAVPDKGHLLTLVLTCGGIRRPRE